MVATNTGGDDDASDGQAKRVALQEPDADQTPKLVAFAEQLRRHASKPDSLDALEVHLYSQWLDCRRNQIHPAKSFKFEGLREYWLQLQSFLKKEKLNYARACRAARSLDFEETDEVIENVELDDDDYDDNSDNENAAWEWNPFPTKQLIDAFLAEAAKYTTTYASKISRASQTMCDLLSLLQGVFRYGPEQFKQFDNFLTLAKCLMSMLNSNPRVSILAAKTLGYWVLNNKQLKNWLLANSLFAHLDQASAQACAQPKVPLNVLNALGLVLQNWAVKQPDVQRALLGSLVFSKLASFLLHFGNVYFKSGDRLERHTCARLGLRVCNILIAAELCKHLKPERKLMLSRACFEALTDSPWVTLRCRCVEVISALDPDCKGGMPSLRTETALRWAFVDAGFDTEKRKMVGDFLAKWDIDPGGCTSFLYG
ncbi:hypothetical protein CAOG_04851 [Capsaspora owczarzaki ATCC 30864]|uniref:hypothetical protein n=1 Tax=Capsaspora owczarzaki (strain ATCC 30864) TaxID=595528 RepID=UPI0001FE4A9D|nr:hypothetical protein CAOG_04851 [Capsaspora owczarzaki ATCC 30864]|eukprot:XP_004347602.1 hypothetical protein CAOG_04851 [Capsaspora owczarzaki ATCC 30864]